MNPRLIVICFILVVTSATAQQKPLVPQIDGGWWQIAKNPDLGKYNGEKQQPVDFAIWQAADGTWQLWSCIRGTKCPGKVTNRLLFGWEGKNLTDKLWTPKGIQLMADTTLGEINGGMQAPYVFMEDNVYYLFYGDWRRICLAKGYDGKRFTRVLGGNGEPDLFTEHSFEPSPNNTARDPMILKCGNTYYCYYTSHTTAFNPDGAAYARTSLDLKNWSASVMVSHTAPYPGNSPRFSDECPFVIYREDVGLYYLFVTQIYGKNSQTTVYASPNPLYFGIDNNTYKVCTLPVAAPEVFLVGDQWYIASTMPDYGGIQLAKLKWVPQP
jgi:hypothetical protein